MAESLSHMGLVAGNGWQQKLSGNGVERERQHTGSLLPTVEVAATGRGKGHSDYFIYAT